MLNITGFQIWQNGSFLSAVLPPFYLEVLLGGNHLVLIVTPSASHDHFFAPFGFAASPFFKLVVACEEVKHPGSGIVD